MSPNTPGHAPNDSEDAASPGFCTEYDEPPHMSVRIFFPPRCILVLISSDEDERA
ncbi:hypothetical protein BIFDEN_01445 [Bifidobacterium dentium ATCC 27678]|nr:hypothetical protein BIFDEN_01445 [Bifidobacterium dentium ATCC 27678]